ncbi:MAG: glycosyltransferase family 2 protein [Nitriliruptoraceae bacterium]
MVAPGAVDTALVVVSHDTRAEVLGALDAVAADPQAPPDLEVVVVDTGSRDGTAGAARAHPLRPRLLELDNCGFGRAANAGMRATSAPVVVLINADVRPRAGALRHLAAALEADDRLAAVGPQVRYPSGVLQASARRQLDARTLLGHGLLGRLAPGNRWTRRYHARDLDPERPRDVDWLSGCALGLRRTAVEQIGGFDPGYFLYVEDLDLGERLRAAGWRLGYEPAAVVEHRVGASTSRRPVRARLHHARSLDRHLARRLHGPARLLRPLLPVGLAGWVTLGVVLDRLRPGASSTGERRDDGQGAA